MWGLSPANKGGVATGRGKPCRYAKLRKIGLKLRSIPKECKYVMAQPPRAPANSLNARL